MRIDGYFNANDEPALTLDLISASIEVLIDTGFLGGLINEGLGIPAEALIR